MISAHCLGGATCKACGPSDYWRVSRRMGWLTFGLGAGGGVVARAVLLIAVPVVAIEAPCRRPGGKSLSGCRLVSQRRWCQAARAWCLSARP